MGLLAVLVTCALLCPTAAQNTPAATTASAMPTLDPSRYFSECPDGCSGHGTCQSSSCVCEQEWKGINCGILKEDCCRPPKGNEKKCHIKFDNSSFPKCRTFSENDCAEKGCIFVPDGGCGEG